MQTSTGRMDMGPFQDGEFVASELGEIPKGWKVKTLNDLISGTFPKWIKH